MSTRKIMNAKDLSTNELIYFRGHAKATYMSDGTTTVEDAINTISNISPAYPIVEHEQSEILATIAPNMFHTWGVMSDLKIKLEEPENSSVANEYVFQFISSDTGTTLTLPVKLQWTSEPVINPDCTYQVSILNNCATLLEFAPLFSGVDELPYLTIEALEDGLTASLSVNACQYSTDGIAWTDLAADTVTPVINTGEKLYFKATGLTPNARSGIGTFTVNKNFNLSGNCMSMLFGDEAEYNLDLTDYEYAFLMLFYYCSTLKSVSAGFLPATTLAEGCYGWMFSGCTGLTTAPDLPTTSLASHCYDSMFYGCTGLRGAPELPATTLADSCYNMMFYETNVLPDCGNIDFSSSAILYSCGLIGLFAGTKVTDSDLRRILPINPNTGNYWLPATTLTESCYSDMFHYCTELTTAPDLPATSLASHCYSDMFYECTGLIDAPELPATTLADSCYNRMFYKCTGLTTAPELPATILVSNCYYQMFDGCSNLNYIKAMFTTTPSYSYTGSWVSRVASTGTFVKNAAATWDVTGINGVPSGWTVETYFASENYLTIEALEDGLTARLSTNACQYSTDGVVWTDLAAGTNTPAINTGEKLYFKATGLTPRMNVGIGTFTVNKNFNLSGNCMSMLFGDEAKNNLDLTGYDYAFNGLFDSCTTLESVSSGFLPATTLADSCYNNMFNGCTGLTTAPELPAMTLAPACYSGMFFYCSGLTTAPELPATTLANGCYNGMFFYCSGLRTAPRTLPATTLANGCYSNMFQGCTRLTTAPALPAMILTQTCYGSMFAGCSNLNYIEALFTTEPSSDYTSHWVDGVSSTGTFFKNAAATWDVTGVNGIPEGWTVQNVR